MEIGERCGKKTKPVSKDPENNVETMQAEDEGKSESSVKKEVEYYATNPYIAINSDGMMV